LEPGRRGIGPAQQVQSFSSPAATARSRRSALLTAPARHRAPLAAAILWF